MDSYELSDEFEDEFSDLAVEIEEVVEERLDPNALPKYREEFLDDVKMLVKYYIDLWFDDRDMCCGGPIPSKMLYSPTNITQILNTDICDGVDRAYEAFERFSYVNDEFEIVSLYEGGIGQDISIVLNFLCESAKRGIPKVFQGGLLLMYLDICFGLDA
jgi:hypothetical protein